MSETISGACALARGAVSAGVSLVASYAGGPATSVVDAILDMTSPQEVRVEWTSNEKVALEMAFGASMGGWRSLFCAKSVGLNIALDPLMTLALSGINAGLVLLIGDDPGGWASQNEQDSRAVMLAAEIPVLEPTTVADAYAAMLWGFEVSEQTGLPVAVRFTGALALARGAVHEPKGPNRQPRPTLPFQREFMRWVVLPINVVSYHSRLHRRLEAVRERFGTCPLNGVHGDGPCGVIAAGFAYQKLMDTLGGVVPPSLRILRLGTSSPVPDHQLIPFLQTVESALVLEETAPLVERAVRAIAHQADVHHPVYGRDTGHVPDCGELFSVQIAQALCFLAPDLAVNAEGANSRHLPSRDPLCEGCPYIPVFDALLESTRARGGRELFFVVGDPGCMARAQLPPYELLDVKISLGSSISIAAGLALTQGQPGSPGSVVRPSTGRHGETLRQSTDEASSKRVVALSGDSSFLHTGLGALIDACGIGATMLVVILDNGTTALTGGQPHPGSGVDARGRPRYAVSLASLAREAGAGSVQTVDIDRGEDIRAAIDEGLDRQGIAVVIARSKCPRWPTGGQRREGSSCSRADDG